MPTGVNAGSGLEENPQPTPKFQTGNLVKVNLVVLTNGLGMFGGLLPEIILRVNGPGATAGTWQLGDIEAPHGVRIPSCPENVLTRVA